MITGVPAGHARFHRDRPFKSRPSHRSQTSKLLIGTIYIRNQGKYGWIEHQSSRTDYYVAQINFGSALPGDQVVFQVIHNQPHFSFTSSTRLKPQAKVVRVQKRKPRNIIVLVSNQTGRIFNLDLQYYRVEITNLPVTDHFYYLAILEQVKDLCLLVRLEKKISHQKSADALTQAVISELGILTTFSDSVGTELKTIPHAVNCQTVVDWKDRLDLTKKTLVTIDGAQAQDFDDAVGVETLTNGNFKLIVAIADVAHYVQPGSALDQAALLRGCSVYLPHQTFSMLPAKLSNDLCSLRPGVPRLCIGCEMEINNQGQVLSFKTYPAIIKSQARLTYDKVDLFLTKKKDLSDLVVGQMLKKAAQLAQVLNRSYQVHGYISLNLIQQKLEFNHDHQVIKIHVTAQNSLSRKMIELFMITANQQVAALLQRNFKQQLIFRNHLPVSSEKLTSIIKKSRNLIPDLKLSPTRHKPFQTIQLIVDQLTSTPDHRRLIDNLVVHNLERAFYAPTNQKHFGLGITTYTHFTSPIRRYPDLLVHRLLKLFFLHQSPSNLGDDERHRCIVDLCNNAEIKQAKCEQAVRKINLIKYMQYQPPKIYSALIKQIYRWGMKVELDNLIRGEINLRNMRDDYYQFDSERQVLVGQRTRKVYQMGQRTQVKLINADLWSRKINFQLVPTLKMKKFLK